MTSWRNFMAPLDAFDVHWNECLRPISMQSTALYAFQAFHRILAT